MTHTSPPHIRWLSRLSTVAVLAGLIVAAPPNLPDATATTNDYVFTGGGWGHSTGMMQYGAYSMAKTDGWTYDQILSHYYGDKTSSGFLGVDVPDPGPLWVNLAQERTAVELFNQSLNSGGDVTFTRGSETLALGKSEAATVTATGTDSCTVDAPGGSLAEGSCTIDVEWDGWEAEPTTSVRLVRSVLLGNTGWSTCSPCRLERRRVTSEAVLVCPAAPSTSAPTTTALLSTWSSRWPPTTTCSASPRCPTTGATPKTTVWKH